MRKEGVNSVTLESSAPAAKSVDSDIEISRQFWEKHERLPHFIMWFDEILAYTVGVQVNGALDFKTQVEQMKDGDRYCFKIAPPAEMTEKMVIALGAALEMGMQPDELMKNVVSEVYGKYSHMPLPQRLQLEPELLLTELIGNITDFGVKAGKLEEIDKILPDDKLIEYAKRYYCKAQLKAEIAMACSLLAIAEVYDKSVFSKELLVRVQPEDSPYDTNFHLQLQETPPNFGFKEYVPELFLSVNPPFMSGIPVEYSIGLQGFNRITGWANSEPGRYTVGNAPELAHELYNALSRAERQTLVDRCRNSASFFQSTNNELNYQIGNEFLALLLQEGLITDQERENYMRVRHQEYRIAQNDSRIEQVRSELQLISQESYRRTLQAEKNWAQRYSLRRKNSEVDGIGISFADFSSVTEGEKLQANILFPSELVHKESGRNPSLRKLGQVRIEFASYETNDSTILESLEFVPEYTAFYMLEMLTEKEKKQLALAYDEGRIVSTSEKIAAALREVLVDKGYISEQGVSKVKQLGRRILNRVNRLMPGNQ